MRTAAQLRANRLNAQRSTGPRTPDGRAIVARNALKHGLLARAALLPGDNAASARALAALSASVHAELTPEGPIQRALVDRIVASLWRLRRVAQVESGLFASQLYDDQVRAVAVEARLASKGETWADDIQRRHAPLVSAGLVQVANTARYQAALNATRRGELNAGQRIPRLGRAFVSDERSFATLSRYEAAIERGLYKALHELERLQRLKAGDAVPAPHAVDVNMDMRVAVDPPSGPGYGRLDEDRSTTIVKDAIAFARPTSAGPTSRAPK
jgi:hypothetical protein